MLTRCTAETQQTDLAVAWPIVVDALMCTSLDTLNAPLGGGLDSGIDAQNATLKQPNQA